MITSMVVCFLCVCISFELKYKHRFAQVLELSGVSKLQSQPRWRKPTFVEQLNI